MTSKLKKTELIIASIFISLVTIHLYGIHISVFLYLSIIALNCIWIYTFFYRKRTAQDIVEMIEISDKIDTIDLDFKINKRKDNSAYKIIEHFFIAFVLWSFVLNITKTHHTQAFIVLSIILLSLYYFIHNTIELIKKRISWADSLERIFAAFILMGFAFRLMHWPGGNFVIVIGFGALSLLLFVFGIINLIKAIQIKKTTMGILAFLFYFSISGIVVYILFDCMFWAGSQTMFSPNFFMSLTCVTVFYLFNLKSNNAKNPELLKITNGMIRKVVVYNGIALFFFFSTMYEYYQLEYGNRPALITLRVKCQVETRSFDELKSCFIESELFKKYQAGEYPEGE